MLEILQAISVHRNALLPARHKKYFTNFKFEDRGRFCVGCYIVEKVLNLAMND